MAEHDHRRRVGEWIDSRRAEASLTLDQLAATSGVARRTIVNAIAGRTVLQRRNHAGLERALGWELGSLQRAYSDGIKPTSAEDTEPSIDMIDADPQIAGLLRDPRLSTADRQRLTARLLRLHREFVNEAREWFGLSDIDPN